MFVIIYIYKKTRCGSPLAVNTAWNKVVNNSDVKFVTIATNILFYKCLYVLMICN